MFTTVQCVTSYMKSISQLMSVRKCLNLQVHTFDLFLCNTILSVSIFQVNIIGLNACFVTLDHGHIGL